MTDETFELCKAVYEATDWIEEDMDAIRDDGAIFKDDTHLIGDYGFTASYTSDYLLKRLPFPTELGRDSLAWIAKWEHGAGSAPKKQIWQRGSTPLIALLRLVLELKKEGIL